MTHCAITVAIAAPAAPMAGRPSLPKIKSSFSPVSQLTKVAADQIAAAIIVNGEIQHPFQLPAKAVVDCNGNSDVPAQVHIILLTEADHDDSIHVPHGREPDNLPGALGLFHHHKLPASLYFRGERIQRGCDKAVAQRMSRVLRMIVDEHADDPGTVLGQQNARHAGNILPLFEQRRHALNRLV